MTPKKAKNAWVQQRAGLERKNPRATGADFGPARECSAPKGMRTGESGMLPLRTNGRNARPSRHVVSAEKRQNSPGRLVVFEGAA